MKFHWKNRVLWLVTLALTPFILFSISESIQDGLIGKFGIESVVLGITALYTLPIFALSWFFIINAANRLFNNEGENHLGAFVFIIFLGFLSFTPFKIALGLGIPAMKWYLENRHYLMTGKYLIILALIIGGIILINKRVKLLRWLKFAVPALAVILMTNTFLLQDCKDINRSRIRFVPIAHKIHKEADPMEKIRLRGIHFTEIIKDGYRRYTLGYMLCSISPLVDIFDL